MTNKCKRQSGGGRIFPVSHCVISFIYNQRRRALLKQSKIKDHSKGRKTKQNKHPEAPALSKMHTSVISRNKSNEKNKWKWSPSTFFALAFFSYVSDRGFFNGWDMALEKRSSNSFGSMMFGSSRDPHKVLFLKNKKQKNRPFAGISWRLRFSFLSRNRVLYVWNITDVDWTEPHISHFHFHCQTKNMEQNLLNQTVLRALKSTGYICPRS